MHNEETLGDAFPKWHQHSGSERGRGLAIDQRRSHGKKRRRTETSGSRKQVSTREVKLRVNQGQGRRAEPEENTRVNIGSVAPEAPLHKRHGEDWKFKECNLEDTRRGHQTYLTYA